MSWTRISLRGAAEVALGRQRAPQHADGPHMVPYLRAANVKDGELALGDVLSMNFTPQEQKTFALAPGDVLVTEGSGSLSSVGAAAVWTGEIDGTICFQNTLLRLRPRPGITDGRFLGWWARSAFGSGVFASIATGANIYHVSAERVRSLPIKLPSIATQRCIVDFLDAEVTRIEKMESLQRTVLAKLDERDRAFLDLELDRLGVRHGMIPFRRAIRRIEQGSSPLCDNFPAGDEEWGVLKVSSVKHGQFWPEENKRLPAELAPESRYEIKTGDLLVTRANTPLLVGAAAVVPEVRGKLMLCDKIFRVDVTSQFDRQFIVLVSRGTRIRDFCGAASHGTSQSMANLKTEEIKEWPIPNAGLSEQHEVVKRVTEQQVVTSSLRSQISRQLELLAERRQALITAAVTGQIDVTTARGIQE
jgi:type I restriction enzyme, S subunit